MTPPSPEGARPVNPRRRRAAILATGLAAAVAAVAVASAIASGEFADAPVGSSTPSPVVTTAAAAEEVAPAAGPVTPEEEAENAAVVAATALVSLTNTVAVDPTAPLTGLDDVAAGFVKGEIEALATERAQLGYTQVGEAAILSVSAHELSLSTEPATMRLDVCIDVSGIDVVDSDGESMAGNMYAPGFPTIHHYGAQLVDGSWKLVTHTIPDTPVPCS